MSYLKQRSFAGLAGKVFSRNTLIFLVLWVTAFILYYPAAKSGKAGTYHREWLIPITQKSFFDYINFSGYSYSLYQFTQFCTYIIFKVFHTGVISWHIIQLTLHIFNCMMFYIIFNDIFVEAKVKNGTLISLSGAFLFCVSPYNSEVIVHEPCLHYLLGFLLLLLTVRCAQKFFQTQDKKYALWAGLLYLPATYSIEVFFLTPLFVLLLYMFYSKTLGYSAALFKKTLLLFTLPQFIMIGINLILLYAVSGKIVAHNRQDEIQNLLMDILTKTPKYIFHLLFLGRFQTLALKTSIYNYFDTTVGIASFWLPLLILIAIAFFLRRKINAKGAVMILTASLFFLSVVLVAPMEFTNILLVLFDRYTYFMMPFFYLFIILLLSSIPFKIIGIAGYAYYCYVNIQFTIMVSDYWDKSTKVIYSLIKNFPDPQDKIVLILNSPESYQGIMMIGAIPISNFKVMYNMETGKNIKNKIYDVMSYNMLNEKDGAHTLVVYDSVLHVELNNWGNWWWYHGDGGASYENDDYSVKMMDIGHWYELTIKHPSSQYLFLYQVGDKWKTVDFNIRHFQY